MNTKLSGTMLALCLTGCSMLPSVDPPTLDLSPVWHAELPHAGETVDLLAWWGSFRDPALSALLELAETNSPTLASAVAAIDSARATEVSARSGLLPSATGSAAETASGTGGSGTIQTDPSVSSSAGLDASWEVDLFGKARATADASTARVESEVAAWHDARVSLAAEVADTYVQYRACRLIEQSDRDELASQRDTIVATQTSASSGFTSTADLALARASAASSSSTLIAQSAECEILVKSLAEVVGVDESKVRPILAKGPSRLPTPRALRVSSLPVDLLRQRPDVAALERELAARLYEIGYARADQFPSLSLSGSLTVSQSSLTGSALPWSFGPALNIPLFDAGKRRAAVDNAEASYRKAAAAYQAGVYAAVDEVETALVRVDATNRRLGYASAAASNYQSYFESIDDNWRAGGASLLDREEARRSARSSEISLIEVRRDAVRYWIALYKALGGGWTATSSVKGQTGTGAKS